MRTYANSRPGPSLLRTAGTVGLTLVAGAAVTVGGLYAAGVELPFWKTPKSVAVEDPQPPGTVKVYKSGKAIPALTLIRDEHLRNPETGVYRYEYATPEWATENGVLTEMQVKGRVLRQDHAVGKVFVEREFYPKGTREGPSAAVPPGKRLFALDADKISGLEGLRAGDHFDLVGSLPVDLDKALAKAKMPGGFSPDLLPGADGNLPKRASVRVLVQDGVIVVPVRAREVPVVGGSHKPNDPPKTRTVQEVMVAVGPDEIAPVTEAVAIKAELSVVARSGHPEDANVPSATKGSIATPRVKTVETIVNGKRETIVFPQPGEGPTPPATPPQ